MGTSYRYKFPGTGRQRRWEPCAWPMSWCANTYCWFVESGCLGVQPKVGGKFLLKLNIGERPIANKYREGKMQRTLKRELKVLEIVKREGIRSSTCYPSIQPWLWNRCGGSEVLFECPLDCSGLSRMWCTLAVSASASVRDLAKNLSGGSVVVASVAIYMFNL